MWRGLLRGWNAPGGGDRLWLMYSANYLLHTGGLRWAIDPVRLVHRLAGAPQVDTARDLKDLSLVVLTHRHEDHLDLELIRSMRGLPVTWVVPEAILGQVQETGIPSAQIVVPHMLETLRFGGLRLTPFEGLHWEKQGDSLHGVPAVGYLAGFSGNRWLFPGDTRSYEAARLPDFGEVDGLAAHLWLGRGAALTEPPPLLEPFLDFCLDLRPRRVLLTHLDEWGRDPTDLWEMRHARHVCRALEGRAPDLPVEPVRMGDCVEL